jgi:hypothetical protein
MIKLSPVLVLVFLCPISWAQSTPTRNQATPPCTVTEDSIFKEARICAKSRDGSLSKADLTVAGFAIGESTLEDVGRRFPGTHQSGLTKDREASTGICVRTKSGDAVVFSSGDLAEPKVVDSIFMARAETFEKQGAKCLDVATLPGGASTKSGIRLGMEKERILALLHIHQSRGAGFAVNYTTSPEKALWLKEKSKPKDGKGWVAMSGAYGGFGDKHLRWVVLYAGLSD